MSRRYSYGYGSYHGRSGFRTFLKVLIVLLLIILLLAVAAFFFLERYLVYDTNGAHLEIPFFQWGATPSPGQEDKGPVSPSPTGDLVVLPSIPVTPTPVPTPTPTPAPVYLQAVQLPRTALYDGTAAQQAAAAGGSAVLFDMKADDGTLGYISNLEIAKAAGVSASDPALNAAIQALCQEDLYTIARVSCFRDQTTPRQLNRLSIKTNSGYNWTDERKLRWLSPTNEEVQQYIAGICAELAALGFDEIVLDNAAYPTAGNLHYIKKGSAYDAAQFSTVVAGFYAQVRTALAAYPEVKLSIVTDAETAAAGANATSGQTVANLLQAADRVWIPAGTGTWSQYVQQFSAQGMTDPVAQLVVMTAQAGGATENWAIVSQ